MSFSILNGALSITLSIGDNWREFFKRIKINTFMIDEFVNVEDEDSKPPKIQMKINCNAHLLKSIGVFFNDDDAHEVDYVEIDFMNNPITMPYGNLFINGNAVIRLTKRSGTWFYHPLLKNCENWEYWGWLAENNRIRIDTQLSNFLRKEFVQFEIRIIDHNLTNPLRERELSEDLKRDYGIPYRADRLLLEDSSPSSLQEYIFLNHIIKGKQPLGPPEYQLIWRRRDYLAREMPDSLPIFLKSINWKDGDDDIGKVPIALVMLAENWSPISTGTLVNTLNIHKFPKDLASQFDISLLGLAKEKRDLN